MKWLENYPDIHNEMKNIEKRMYSSIKSRQPFVEKTISELIDAGGKRLRPLLLVLAAKNGAYEERIVVPLAAAIEIVHMATLVHDDIIDESHLRRGVDTVQAKWGKEVAVFTGDYLLCKAFMLMPKNYDSKKMSSFICAIKTICEGEMVQYTSRYKAASNIRRYLKRTRAKTAVLFALSGRIGAQEAGSSKKVVSAFSKFGMHMGMAFQITDDILDFTGKTNDAGKPVARDFIQGIYTLPIVYAMQDRQYAQTLKHLMTKQSYTEEDMRKVADIAFESGGIAFSKQLADKYIKKAAKQLKYVSHDMSKALMRELLDILIDRKR